MGGCIVNFKTPTRIKHNGVFFEESIPFYNLFCRLADRFQELIFAYAPSVTIPGLDELKEQSREIGSIVCKQSYINTCRTSSRTGNKCNLSGFVGQVLYTGNLEPFANLLAFLPWISVGSSTAFGCGCCSLLYNES